MPMPWIIVKLKFRDMLRLWNVNLLILSVFILSQNGQAQESQMFNDLSVRSKILKKEIGFGIYLPPNYEHSELSYPVLYLLHGGGGTEGTQRHQRLIREFKLKETLDKAISEDSISPMIVVIPDAGMSYYMNSANEDYRYEDYFINELIPHIEHNYRSKTGKDFRGISGFSMGGYGSLLYGLHHPDKFSAVAAIGPAIRTDNEIREMPHEQFLRRYQSAVGPLHKGDERITRFWHSNSILHLIQNLPEGQETQVKIQIVIGDEDYLYTGNSELHELMKKKNIPHEYWVVEGKHFEYFNSEFNRALKFISTTIKK